MCHIVEQGNQERVQIQRIEYPLHDIHQMFKSDDELQLSFHIRNRDIDLGNRDSDSGIDFHQAGNVSVEIDVCFKIVYIQFNPAH